MGREEDVDEIDRVDDDRNILWGAFGMLGAMIGTSIC